MEEKRYLTFALGKGRLAKNLYRSLDGVVPISFTHREKFYYLRFSDLEKFWNRAQEGGRKSFRYEELNPAYFLPQVSGVLVPYLQVLQKDLEDRD